MFNKISRRGFKKLKAKDLRYFYYPPDVDLDVIIERTQLKLDPVYPPLPDLKPYNPRIFPFDIGDMQLCKRERVEVLVFVKTTHAAREKRLAIRKTWGQPDCWTSQVRILFLFGHTGHSWQSQALREEQAKFGDILKQPFRDSYYNNTLKLMMGFEYFVRHCSTAKFLVMVDDDYLVNPSALMSYIANVHRRLLPRFISGYVWFNALPMRDPKSKWYMSLQRYPFKMFPPYAEAGTLIVSKQLAQDLFIAMQYTQYHPFDDVFVGIVLFKLHIIPVHCKGISHTKPKKLPKNFVTIHGFNKPQALLDAWKQEGLLIRCMQTKINAVQK